MTNTTRRTIIGATLALALAAGLAVPALAETLILYMLPGDYAAFSCPGSWSVTVGGGEVAAVCSGKGGALYDVQAVCFGTPGAALGPGGSLTVTCGF